MVVDFRGEEIRVGDLVAYPLRQSSSMWMNVGVVCKITEKEPRGTGSPDSVYTEYFKRIAFELDVTIVDSSDSIYGTAKGKNVHLTAVERVVVLR